MAHEIKLEVYTLRIRKQRDDRYVRLDSFIANNDFYSFFQDYVSSFDNQLSLSESQKKSIQFQNGSVRVLRDQRIISGIIESGDYGLESKIVNIRTGQEQYHKTVEDTDIKPFYFLLYLPINSDKAFIILQRLGIYGINGVFKMHLDSFFKERFGEFILEFSPFVSRQLAHAFIDNGSIKELSLRRYNLPTDVIEKLGLIGHEEDILSIELRITAKQKRTLPFNNRVRSFIDNPNAAMFDIRELNSLGFNGEHKSSIKVKLGNNTRTVDLSDTGQIRPYYDIDNQILKDVSGHPVFASINEIAISLINDLVNELNR